MIEVIQSTTQKKYYVSGDNNTVLKLKQCLVNEIGNVSINNLKLLKISHKEDSIYPQPVNDTELVTLNNRYIVVIIPIDCQCSKH